METVGWPQGQKPLTGDLQSPPTPFGWLMVSFFRFLIVGMTPKLNQPTRLLHLAFEMFEYCLLVNGPCQSVRRSLAVYHVIASCIGPSLLGYILNRLGARSRFPNLTLSKFGFSLLGMKISIKPAKGDGFHVEVLGADTVESLKQAIAAANAPSRQKLMHNGEGLGRHCLGELLWDQ